MTTITKNCLKKPEFVKEEILHYLGEDSIVILKEFTNKNLLLEWIKYPAIEQSEKCAILECLHRALNTGDKNEEAKFLQKLISIKYILMTFMSTIIAKQLVTQQEVNSSKKIARIIFEIIRNMFLVLPASFLEFVDIILPQIKILIRSPSKDLDLCTDIKILEDQKNNIFSNEIPTKITHQDNLAEMPPPPSSFRELSVIPTIEEINSTNKPYLRPNVVVGKYDNAEHYLDIHFRLMREDMFRYFRECIAEYKERKLLRIWSEKLCNGHIFFNCYITEVSYNLNGLNFKTVINFRKNVNWSTTKRLSSMSLICISSDEFQTFEFATIHDRHPTDGISCDCTIIFMLETKYNNFFLDYSKSYDIIETSAFFESYKHVLKKMKFYKEKKFPLSSCLLHLENFTEKPNYFHESKNISAEIYQYICREEKKFDKHQLAAFEMALTNTVSLIQGPPGTGKTFLGLEIVKYLIQHDPSSKMPILVVCYTNHALDQFLEGVLAFTDKVIRIGSRCKSSMLQSHVLSKLQSIVRNNRKRFPPKWINDKEYRESSRIAKLLKIGYTDIGPHISDVRSAVNQLNHIEYILKCLDDDPLGNEDVAFEFIPYQCFYHILGSFIASQITNVKQHFRLLIQGIEDWLCLSTITMYVYEEFPEILCHLIIELHEKETAHQKNTATKLQGCCNTDKFFVQMHKICQNTNIFKHPILQHKYQNLTMQKKQDLVGLFLKQNIQSFSVIETAVRKYIKLADYETDFPTNDVSNSQFRSFNYSSQGMTQETVKNLTSLPSNSGQDSNSIITHSDIALDWKKESSNTDFFNSRNTSQNTDIWELSLLERWKLFLSWKDKTKKSLQNRFDKTLKSYKKKFDTLESERLLYNILCLSHAEVIGLTTTGAAKNWKVLEKAGINIVLVEEAAEVLEAHILTSLTKTTDHLILIGDHKQLKPNPNVYELALKYKLDISMFERLLTNGAPSYCLQLQHRMRPCIAELLVPEIYDRLDNHFSVLKYENIKGMVHNMFFIDHQEYESKGDEMSSHVNEFEAQFLVCLCEYLLKQGYSTQHITVLTTYVGQLLLLKSAMSKRNLQSVRVSTVDNFQGEENEIILLSLVRSNDDEIMGFLKASNRVCVALSRAKKGLYCIGNFKLFCSKAKLWRQITSKLKQKKLIAGELPLKCEKHQNTVTYVASETDFVNVVDGGCNNFCSYRLQCGHVCPLFCHPLNNHSKIPCKRPHCSNRNNHLPPTYADETSEKGKNFKGYHSVQNAKGNCLTGKMNESINNNSTNRYTKRKLHEATEASPRKHQKKCLDYISSNINMDKTVKVKISRNTEKQNRIAINDENEITEPKKHATACKKGNCKRKSENTDLCRESTSKKMAKSLIDKLPKIMDSEKFPVKQFLCKRRHVYFSDKKDYLLCDFQLDKSLACGHTVSLPCSKFDLDTKCNIHVQVQLPCGHKSNVQCSVKDKLDSVQCVENVTKRMICGENVQYICFQGIQHKCSFTSLKCGHKISCNTAEDGYECKLSVNVNLSCSHEIIVPCNERDKVNHVQCSEIVAFMLSCGHDTNIMCHIARMQSNSNTEAYQSKKSVFSSVWHCKKRCETTLPCGHQCFSQCGICSFDGHTICTEQCKVILDCGHKCPGVCNECSSMGIHAMCIQVCHTVLPCGHKAIKPCGAPTQVCVDRCLIQCSHARCMNSCQYPCTKCQKSCDWQCTHLQCTKTCSEFCDRPPCDFPCTKSLPCGHPCVGFCGEPCPSFCCVCNSHTSVESNKDRFILLEDCNHSFQLKIITSWLQKQPLDMHASCPKCGTIVTRNKRFGNVIKRRNIAFKCKFMKVQEISFNFSEQDTIASYLDVNSFHSSKYKSNIGRCIANDMLRLNIANTYIPTALKMSHNYEIVSFVLNCCRHKMREEYNQNDVKSLQLLETWILLHKTNSSGQQTKECSRSVRRIVTLCYIRSKWQTDAYLSSELIQILETTPFTSTTESKFLQKLDKLTNNTAIKSLQEFFTQLKVSQNSSKFDCVYSFLNVAFSHISYNAHFKYARSFSTY